MRIGILGTGTIATAVVRGIAGDGHEIVVSNRSAANADALARAFDNVTIAENQAVLDQADVVILGLIAEVAPKVMGPLQFRPDQEVISLMAGADLDTVASLVAPATASAVMLPFPGIAQGGSPILALGDMTLLEVLFGERNRIYALRDAAELNAYLCAQALLSPVARMVADTADWLGARVADQEQGEAFLRQLVSSSLADTSAAELIEALNTEGGYNQRLRLHMERAGMGQILAEGLDELE